jgi:hypothetical protein
MLRSLEWLMKGKLFDSLHYAKLEMVSYYSTENSIFKLKAFFKMLGLSMRRLAALDLL